MRQTKKLRILLIVMCVTFGITFSIGIFNNPNFNIYDFCMNLASEVLGMVITLVIVDTYIAEKKKARTGGDPPEPDEQ